MFPQARFRRQDQATRASWWSMILRGKARGRFFRDRAPARRATAASRKVALCNGGFLAVPVTAVTKVGNDTIEMRLPECTKILAESDRGELRRLLRRGADLGNVGIADEADTARRADLRPYRRARVATDTTSPAPRWAILLGSPDRFFETQPLGVNVCLDPARCQLPRQFGQGEWPRANALVQPVGMSARQNRLLVASDLAGRKASGPRRRTASASARPGAYSRMSSE
jgi:hypothetical protein